MKVIIDGSPLASQSAGIGRWTSGVVKGLLRVRPESSVVLVDFRDARAPTHLLPEGTVVKTLPWPGRLHRALLMARALPRMEFYAGRSDAMIGSGFVPWPADRASEIPVIHDLAYLRYPRSVAPRFRRYLTVAVPRAIRRAPVILTVSEAVKVEISETYGVESGRIHVVPNAAELRTENQPASAPGLPESFLLVVGTLEPRKNIVRILEAYRLLRQDRDAPPLVVAGASSATGGEEATALAAAGGEGVIWLGYVPDDVLAGLYARAVGLVFPSLYEGFGIPILEAMDAGCPVVTSDGGAMAEVAGDAALLVNPLDPQEIAEAMRKVIEDDGLTTGLVAKGRQRVARYSWAAAGAALSAALDEAVEGGAPRVTGEASSVWDVVAKAATSGASLSVFGDEETMPSIPYTDLVAVSEKVAAGLNDVGIVKGDRVALWAVTSFDFVKTVLGVWRGGGRGGADPSADEENDSPSVGD